MHAARRPHLALALLAVLALVLTGLVTSPTARAATGDGSPTDSNISFVGRWDTRNASAYVPGFAGAYFQTGFTGTSVKLRQRNAIDIYYSIDGGAEKYIQNVSGTVDLTPNRLASGNHRLRVSYRVVAGSYHGDAVFQGLVLDSGARTVAWPRPARLLEFVGDSITVGTTSSKNALTAYGWLTGEQLGAAHTQVAVGASCLVSAADGCIGMADRFFYTNFPGGSPAWDFSRYQASAVIINLGTNDSGHGVHTPEFQATYTTLLKNVRSRYPNAAIFAMQTFRDRFTAQTRAAVQAMTDAGDRNTWFVPTTGWLSSSELSDGVHPNDAGHRTIAAKLGPIIAAKLGTTPTSPPVTTPATTPTTTPPTTATTTPPTTTTPAATTPAATTTTAATTPPASTTTPVSTTSSPSSSSCAVTYTVTNSWPGGFQADVAVANTGTSALDGWTLAFTLPGDQKVGSAWNAVATQSGGAVSATNAAYNGRIPAGGSTSFGFTATGSTTGTPTAFTLNGSTCRSAGR